MRTSNRTLTIALATLMFVFAGTIAEAQDSSAPTSVTVDDLPPCPADVDHCVDFRPWGNRQIEIRDANGKWIDWSKGAAPFRIEVADKDYRAAITPAGIDIGTLLRNMSPVTDPTDGKLYLRMNIMQDMQLANGSVISGGTETNPSVVMIKIDDFYVSKSMQPADSSTAPDATAPLVTVTNRFNETLATTGVTAATDPGNSEDDASDAATPGDDEDEAEEPDTTPNGWAIRPGNGSPFPNAKIFSSPICSSGARNVPTSGFGYRGHPGRGGRCHASNGKRMSCNHKGFDIGARMGTKVLAAADGCFKMKGSPKAKGTPVRNPRELWENGYGPTIRLVHGNGFESQYSHLSRLAPNVIWGRCVRRGDVIGYTGNSGQSTGPHLHFGVWKNGKAVNPGPYLQSTAGTFFNPSCSKLGAYKTKYVGLDQEMRDALFGQRKATRSRSTSKSSVR